MTSPQCLWNSLAKHAGLAFFVFLALAVFPVMYNGHFIAQSGDAEKQMEALKTEIERSGPAAPALRKKYDRLAAILSDCSPTGQILKTLRANDPLAPQNNLCISGSLAVGDPTYNRPAASSTGSGLGGACGPSGSATAVFHDVIGFNLTGCAAFPTVVTISLCGPAGCVTPQSLDSVLLLYRNVTAGDPLSGNGGLPGVFNAASPCTNARALNDDTGATPTAPGGSTCNQLNTSDCTAGCSLTTSLSQMKRSLGDGRFTVVVTSFSNGATANYNLYVDAPGAGCNVAFAPSAANGAISGRVLTAGGRGIGKTVVTVSGGSLSRPITALTNAFGYYTIEGLDAGMTYSVSVGSKGIAFSNPTQIVTVQDDLTAVDFTSIE